VTIYLAAILIVAGVALFVAAPLTGESLWRRTGRRSAEAERLEHERELAMQGLRELEFDREMDKLSDPDYAALKAPLEERALAAMGALERLRNEPAPGAPSAPVVRPLRPMATAPSGTAIARQVRFCPECGSAVGGTHKFCGGCGAPLAALRRAGGEAG
jgi:NADH pyrophosphatase NudC (nudix superfamily)